MKTVSAPQQRKLPVQKPSPIPSQQQRKKLAVCQETQQLIKNTINEWYTYTLAKANDLSKQFNKKPRYFLDIFFQGGTKMANHHHKINMYSAFKSLKAADLNKGFFFLLSHLEYHSPLTTFLFQKDIGKK
jgi:hypothetical protein